MNLSLVNKWVSDLLVILLRNCQHVVSSYFVIIFLFFNMLYIGLIVLTKILEVSWPIRQNSRGHAWQQVQVIRQNGNFKKILNILFNWVSHHFNLILSDENVPIQISCTQKCEFVRWLIYVILTSWDRLNVGNKGQIDD